MVKLILYALPFLAMFAPNMWVHYVFRKNDEHFSDMPFTAHEFGKKIIDYKTPTISVDLTICIFLCILSNPILHPRTKRYPLP